jgi:aryl-alcohol dehydrogenase-like predicted oxidoreductase
MKLTRREIIKIATAGSVTSLLQGWQPLLAQSDELITKAIPSTGEAIPVIGIGARNYRVGAGWAPDTSDFIATLRTFHQLGGRLIDTSPNYGESEVVVGDILANLGIRDDLFVATKVDREDRGSGITRMDNSLKRMHTDHFELMQIHNLVGWQTQLPLIREWKQAGRFKYIGVTTSSESQYDELEHIMRQEDLDFIQIDYALDERGAANRILPLAADRGMAVLINLPFGRGRLFKRVAGHNLPDWAAEIDCDSWAQYFLKYVVSHSAVTAAIPGTTKPHHIIDNMGAAQGRLPDQALRTRMQKFIDNLPAV